MPSPINFPSNSLPTSIHNKRQHHPATTHTTWRNHIQSLLHRRRNRNLSTTIHAEYRLRQSSPTQPRVSYSSFNHCYRFFVFNSQTSLAQQISKALKSLPEPIKPTPQLLQDITDLTKVVTPILCQEYIQTLF